MNNDEKWLVQRWIPDLGLWVTDGPPSSRQGAAARIVGKSRMIHEDALKPTELDERIKLLADEQLRFSGIDSLKAARVRLDDKLYALERWKADQMFSTTAQWAIISVLILLVVGLGIAALCGH